MPTSVSTLSLGQISGLHGVRGALRIHLHHEQSASLRPSVTLTLLPADGAEHGTERPTTYVVDRFVAPTRGRVGKLWLRGVDRVELASELVGCTVCVDRGAVPLQADEYLLADLIGKEVVERRGEQVAHLGRAVGVTSNGAQDLLEIEYAAGETWLLPLVPGFVDEIDSAVWVRLPEEFLPESLERTIAARCAGGDDSL